MGKYGISETMRECERVVSVVESLFGDVALFVARIRRVTQYLSVAVNDTKKLAQPRLARPRRLFLSLIVTLRIPR